MNRTNDSSRRRFLAASAAGISAVRSATAAADLRAADDDRALIAITLDLEMSRNFPDRADTHWDYEKGNLNAQTKAYTAEACRRVKAAGGLIHCFAVGRVFEQENVDWLKGIVQAGHPVGNHTYDHVNVLATRPDAVQFRFQRAPWLIEGHTASEVIRENVCLATAAMKARLRCDPIGFRTPGGFPDGLHFRPDVRAMLREQGFDWVSSLYPPHATPRPMEEPGTDILESIVRAQAAAQPFIYPDGLVEVPMSPISDIGAFRTGRWRLEWFLKAVRLGVEWAIDQRATYDFLGHPSCLYVTDPDFRTIDLICDLVRKSGDRAAIVGLDAVARRAWLRRRRK
jgi:peptidoglycan/xylan/chitin deacetylase (PgdA/CDA1 family)